MKRFKVFSLITGHELADGIEFADTTCAMHFHRIGKVIPGPRGGVAWLLEQPSAAIFRLEWVD